MTKEGAWEILFPKKAIIKLDKTEKNNQILQNQPKAYNDLRSFMLKTLLNVGSILQKIETLLPQDV